ncbi:MAG: uroporphyrinogen decarboxylase family protein, partial [Lachnospiraceae bacterium]
DVMTSRERLLCVMNGQIPDRVPISPFVQEEYLSYYFNKKNTSRLYDAVQLCKELEFDLITRQYINVVPFFLQHDYENWKVVESKEIKGGNYIRRTIITTPEGELIQIEGAEYNEKILEGIHFSTIKYMLETEDDFLIFKKYCPKRSEEDNNKILEAGIEAKNTIGDLGISCPWAIGGVFNLIATYMDVQNILCDALMDEEYYKEYMEFFTNMVIEENRIFAKSTFDAVGIQGNIANGAIMSAEYFDQHVLPYEKRGIDVFKESGKPTIYHNCGNAKVLYPCYKKLGITVWETVSPSPQGDNDLSDAKEYFKQDLVLSGNFDQIHFLKNESSEAVEEAAFKLMQTGKKEGHFIFSCSDYLEVGTPIENVKALFRGAKRGAEY